MTYETNIENELAAKLQQLSDKVVPPEELKTEVFKTIDRIRHISEIADLFTAKFMQCEIKLLTGGDVDHEDIA